MKVSIIMKLRVLVTVLSSALALQCFAQDFPKGFREEAVAAIESLLEARERAFDQRDVAALVPLYKDDADFVTSNAYWWRGRDEIEKGLRVVLALDGPFSASTRSSNEGVVEKIRFLTENIAIVHKSGESEFPDFRRPGRGTRVVINDDGEWRFLVSHNTAVVVPNALRLPDVESIETNQPTLVSTWTTPGRASESRADEETAIRDLIAASVDAINAKDAAAYTALFVEDGDLVTANAKRWSGREEIERGMQIALNGADPPGRLSERVERIRFLAAGLAVVHAWGEVEDYVVPTVRTARPTRPLMLAGRATRIVAKEEGQWRVLAYQGTQLRVPPESVQSRLPGIQRPEGHE